MATPNKTLILFMLILLLHIDCQYLVFSSPNQLAEEFPNNKIKVHVSPLGLKPTSGIIHGQLKLSDPLSACSELPVVDISIEQDTFLLADDVQCLESVKAKNIAHTGAYIGIIKRNINNTLHDREINIVHIPILEIEPNEFDMLIKFMNNNPGTSIALKADFSQEREKHHKIRLELWLSPTEEAAYSYISSMNSFILNQADQIEFMPRFVLHSQTARKQYVGCLSSGRFCPPEVQYEGKPEGTAIVSQSLRQILIATNSPSQWLKYAYRFYHNCLRTQEEALWEDQNSVLCSENAMRSEDINADAIFTSYNQSFQGNRAQVDGNLVLQEQRQAYIAEKISNHPILLVNGKGYNLTNSHEMKIKICSMINPDPYLQTKQCQKITKPALFSTGEILIGAGVILVLMVGVMFCYKLFIHRKMKKEMRGEVDKTLSQYYRYMETLEEPDEAIGKIPLVQPKIKTNQIGSVELTDVNPPEQKEEQTQK